MDHLLRKDAFLFVVAEEKGIRDTLTAILQTEGFEHVLAFAHAADVLQMAEAVIPDVYIIEYDFPGMTGLQLYEQLQATGPYVPCIFLDAPVSLIEWNHRLVWNLDEPFRIGELLNCVRNALHYASHVSLVSWKHQVQSGPNP